MNPLDLITAVRESFYGSVKVYTQGSCFWFFKILKSVFPDAEPKYLPKEGHVITLIGDTYYDIEGEYDIEGKGKIKNMLDTGYILDYKSDGPVASKWKFNISDIHVECPRCNEPFLRAELQPENINKTRKRYAT